MKEIVLPSLGENVTEATISKWLVQRGDYVTEGDFIVEIETDKSAVEIPALSSGFLTDIFNVERDKVAVGTVLGRLREKEGEEAAPWLEAGNTTVSFNMNGFYSPKDIEVTNENLETVAHKDRRIGLSLASEKTNPTMSVSYSDFYLSVGLKVKKGDLICLYDDKFIQFNLHGALASRSGVVSGIFSFGGKSSALFDSGTFVCVISVPNTHANLVKEYKTAKSKLVRLEKTGQVLCGEFDEAMALRDKVLKSLTGKFNRRQKKLAVLEQENETLVSQLASLKKNPLDQASFHCVLTQLNSRIEQVEWQELESGTQDVLVKLFNVSTSQNEVSDAAKTQASNRSAHLQEFKALMEMYDAKIRVARKSPLEDEELQDELIETWKLLRDREIAAIEGD